MFNTLISTDGYETSHSRLAYLKRGIKEEIKLSSNRSSNIEALLYSHLARKLSVAQKHQLKSLMAEANSYTESLYVLKNELRQEEKSARSQFLKLLPLRIVLLVLLFLIIAPIFDAAKNDWILAGSTLFLTTLYIYTYKLVEDRYILPIYSEGINRRLFAIFVYLNRWLFFIAFLVLEAIVLIEWELLKTESGQAIIVPFWLGVLAAIYLGLANIQRALSFRVKWPKNQFWRDAVYTLYLYPVLYGFIHLIVHAFFAADELRSHELLGMFSQELAIGVVIASTFATLSHLYFVRVGNRISKT